MPLPEMLYFFHKYRESFYAEASQNDARQLWNFYQLRFPEFDANVF